MYYKISDFIEDWKFESAATLKIFSALSDESLKQAVTNDGRTIGKLAWHITTSVSEMINRTGLTIDCSVDNNAVPKSVNEIKTVYEKVSTSLLNEISKKWNDDSLQQEVDMYGEMWKNGTTLGVLITHQIHHRAQITILMRQAGLKVPGIYGPSKEEWTAYGMPQQD